MTLQRNRQITIVEQNRLIILKNDIGVMGYVNTEWTGVMDPAVLVMVKD